MARVHIELPSEFKFKAVIPIRIGDINRAWHLSHVNMISILEEARAQYMLSKGYDYEVNNIQHEVGFILGDLAVIFKRQGHYGQTLEVNVAAADFQEKSFDIVYQVVDAGNGQELARAKTGVLVFDYQSQKVVPVSRELKAKLME